MKKLLLLLILMLPTYCIAQENGTEKKLTKFEKFSSKTGVITKFQDVIMPNIKETFLGTLETRVRTFFGDQKNDYYYRIEEPMEPRSLTHIAMIEYSDLVEINKALTRIAAQVDTDIQSNPDYLENKFVTDDGFKVGYYISKGKARWFVTFEQYSSNTAFIKDQENLINSFKDAQTKIEELKTKYGK